MVSYVLGEVIAARELHFLCADGTTIPCSVELGRPVQGVEGDWICPYQLSTPDKTRTLGMHGFDSMQALILSVKTLDVEIDWLAKTFDAQVRFLDGGHDSIFSP